MPRTVKRIAIIIVVALTLVFGAWLAYSTWQRSRAAAMQSPVNYGQGVAIGKAGGVAVETVGNNNDNAIAIDKTVKEGTDAIANAPAGDSNDAALRASCKLRSFSNTDRCRQLLQVNDPVSGPNSIPTNNDVIYCPDVQRRLTKFDCDDLHQAVERTKTGVAAFNVPGTLTRGKSTTIQLAVGFGRGDVGGQPILDPIEVIKQQGGEAESYRPMVGKDMKAELLGQGFKIEPLTDIEQQVSDLGVTTWEWKVTALEKGLHTLILKTVVEGVTADGKKFALIPTSWNQKVLVHVSWDQQLFDFLVEMPVWLKTIGAILTALTALFTAYFGLRALVRTSNSRNLSSADETTIDPQS
jgi:hypothetical protein